MLQTKLFVIKLRSVNAMSKLNQFLHSNTNIDIKHRSELINGCDELIIILYYKIKEVY